MAARLLAFNPTPTSSPLPQHDRRELLASLINKLQIIILIAPWALQTINLFVERLLQLLRP